jgi:hypothetical protein
MVSGNLAKICIIGAGPSGFTLAKRLKDHSIPFEIFDKSDEIGGNWYYRNPNGMSACYKSLHIDTSKTSFSFEEFPVPAHFPAYPHQSQMFEYLRNYVNHFGLREHITFNTSVESAKRGTDGVWSVTLSTGESREYDGLAVCNGHHWSPRMPNYPGQFDGHVIHSHKYNDPFDPISMIEKTVLVVGMGNSAIDIAAELAARSIARRVFVSARRPVWIFPKFVAGKPTYDALTATWAPPWLAARIAEKRLRANMGRMEDYNLPSPKEHIFQSHGTISTDFLMRAASGDITIKPDIERLDGNRIRFVDGSAEAVDVIVYGTGYNIEFPFFSDPDLQPDEDNHFQAFKRIFRPRWDNLFFLGLAQSRPTLVNLAEQQSKLVAAYIMGRYRLPPRPEMEKIIEADETFYLGHYYTSPRHAMQVEFPHYVADMRQELIRGARRAKAAGYELPIRPHSHIGRKVAAA